MSLKQYSNVKPATVVQWLVCWIAGLEVVGSNLILGRVLSDSGLSLEEHGDGHCPKVGVPLSLAPPLS